MHNQQAYQFFKDLEQYLNQRIPPPKNIRNEIDIVVKRARKSTDQRHKAFPEGAFLNHYIAYPLYEFVSAYPGMDKEKAHQALLSESFRQLSDISSGPPARREAHPFMKILGAKPRQIIKQWKCELESSPVIQSCPDLALRSPFPHKIVFEGKYFKQGGIYAAETNLAKDIYQTFFYLGLSYLPETKTHPAWDYDHGCLLAYDATEEGSLLKAWDGFDPRVRKGCWEGANIYVMILRGENHA